MERHKKTNEIRNQRKYLYNMNIRYNNLKGTEKKD